MTQKLSPLLAYLSTLPFTPEVQRAYAQETCRLYEDDNSVRLALLKEERSEYKLCQKALEFMLSRVGEKK